MTESRLEIAMRHVLSGRKIVAAQKLRVENLRKHGHDTREAERLLVLYERSQAIFEQDLERIIANEGK